MNQPHRPTARFLFRCLASASLSCLAIGTAQAQSVDGATANPAAADQQNDAAAAPIDQDSQPDIVVTGFRASIQSALSLKRDSTSAVDAIVAQDIANFPDQNLAESLQRIPGISIARSRGEGSTITVRGLGPDFTRVRLNGMETVATTPDSGGRGFNFNIFASDLFNSIVVHKTAEAQLEDGSLGAIVDLNTGNPSSFKKGLTVVASAKGQYNFINDKVGPRLAGLVAYNSPSGIWAASGSVAYAKYKTVETGSNTVGWQQARFRSVDGVPCFAGGRYVSSGGCDAVALAYHPRIPRYGALTEDRTRLGITGSVEINPSDTTKINLDGLYSYYKDTHQELFQEGLLRSFEKNIDVTDYSIDEHGTLRSATFNNVQLRSEPNVDMNDVKFYQFNGSIAQEFSDSFKGTLFGGFSKSNAQQPHSTTLISDYLGANGYSYDYANLAKPGIILPAGYDNPSNYALTEIRDTTSSIVNKFRTIRADLDWQANDELSITFGGFYRHFSYDNQSGSRGSTYCAAYGCAAGQIGLPLNADNSYTYAIPGLDAPAGSSTTLWFADQDKIIDQLNFFSRPLDPTSLSSNSVRETETGGYFQFNIDSTLLGMPYTANVGVRYVHTQQSSTGLNSAQEVTIERGYEDFLPALNIALHPTRNVIVRAAVGKVIKRPGLGDLSPGGSVDGFAFNVNYGNPQLEPTRATTYDASVEWYFAPAALLSVAYFRKEIESFPVGSTYQGTYASTGLPTSLIDPNSIAGQQGVESQPWTIHTTVNGPGGVLQGVELTAQLPFHFLPGFLKRSGLIGNVTFIDSSFPYTVSGPATSATTSSFPQLAPSRQIDNSFFGASKWAYNATLYYEDAKFSLRGSVAYRGDYNTGTGSYGNVLAGTYHTLNLDAQAGYQLTKNVRVTLEGLNLTNQADVPFVDEASGRLNYYHASGRVLMAGARLSF